MEGYNSADYYNNHKTTKNTYGDEPIDDRRAITKNQSSKDLRAMKSRDKNLDEDNSRVRNVPKSSQNLGREKMRIENK